MGPWKVVGGRVCTQGGVVPQIPEEILLELRPPKGQAGGNGVPGRWNGMCKGPVTESMGGEEGQHPGMRQ